MAELERSLVWGVNSEAYKGQGGLLRGLDETLDQSTLRELCGYKENVAVKVDVGELGNIRYLRPVLIRRIVEKIQEYGSTPLLVDTVGMVGNPLNGSNDWFYTTSVHGFSRDIIPADGYTGGEGDLLPIDGDELGGVEVARGVSEASALVVVSHVTGHPMFGFNGALFSQGAGCAAQKGKGRIFKPVKPVVNLGKCDNCQACISLCPIHAISAKGDFIEINHERCKGCNHYCLYGCPQNAIEVSDEARQKLSKRVVEAASAVNIATKSKLFYINFLVDIGQFPDYYPVNDQTVVPDLGVLASRDPVAIDQATLDWLNKAPGFFYGGGNYKILAPGSSKFTEIHGVNEAYPLQYAEEYGLGSRNYNLEKIGG